MSFLYEGMTQSLEFTAHYLCIGSLFPVIFISADFVSFLLSRLEHHWSDEGLCWWPSGSVEAHGLHCNPRHALRGNAPCLPPTPSASLPLKTHPASLRQRHPISLRAGAPCLSAPPPAPLCLLLHLNKFTISGLSCVFLEKIKSLVELDSSLKHCF